MKTLWIFSDWRWWKRFNSKRFRYLKRLIRKPKPRYPFVLERVKVKDRFVTPRKSKSFDKMRLGQKIHGAIRRRLQRLSGSRNWYHFSRVI